MIREMHHAQEPADSVARSRKSLDQGVPGYVLAYSFSRYSVFCILDEIHILQGVLYKYIAPGVHIKGGASAGPWCHGAV